MAAATNFDPTALARRIAANADDVDAKRIDWDTFSKRAFALWDEASQGEPCVIGSACAQRVLAVNQALKEIPAWFASGSPLLPAGASQ